VAEISLSEGRTPTRQRGVRHSLVLLGAVGALAAVSACGGSSGGSSGSTSSGTYNVAIVSYLTGPYAPPTGVNVAAGAQAAAYEINKHGGVDGHKLSVKTYDLGNDAGAVLREAAGSNPVAMVGYVDSNDLTAAESLLDSANIPLLTAGANDTFLGPPPKPWYYDASTGIATHATAVTDEAAHLMGGSLKGKKVDIIGLQAVSVEQSIALVKQEIQSQGGTVGLIQQTPVTQVDYASETAAIAASHPNVVEQYLVGPAVVTFSKELVTAGFHGPDVSWSTGSASSVIKAIASPEFYSDRVGPEPAANNALGQAAAAAGVSKNATESDAATGYTEVGLVAKALAACGSPQACTPTKLETAIDNLPPTHINGGDFGDFKYSSTDRFGERTYQFFTYDQTSGDVVQSGAGITVSLADIPK
jgi:ABC-type branched-subunit amino acid transport system substrate-binding protein